MTVESLYTTETPDSGNGDLADLGGGGKGGTTAGTFVFASTGTVKGVRFYAPATVSAGHTFTAELWAPTGTDGSSTGTGTGTSLASKAVSGSSITGGTWNVINFDTPVNVSANTPYRHQVHNSAGRYTARVGYYATDHTNGNVTGYAADHNYGGSIGTLKNNTFAAAVDAGTYANSFFNTPSYLVDTQFEASVLTPIDLVIQDAAHAHAAGNLALTQVHILAIQNAAQAQSASSMIIGIPGLAPPASRTEIIAAASRREIILAENRTEIVTL